MFPLCTSSVNNCQICAVDPKFRNMDQHQSEESLIKILVATDNHLGYGEKDPIRGDDSFVAFEECLQHAQENEVDFILLGGDLFHDTNPSANSLHRCLKMLRRYTLGDKPIEFEIISKQEVNFIESLHQTANYEDPNMNISIPVFSIHGNHDDPSGFGRLSSLDILSITGLVNYFGKWINLEQVTINPIMIRKGETKLALYGLSHIHDNRLVRLFQEYKVTLEKPEKDWFNLMVLHQNRADRGPKNYVPEDILPAFLDLVIWGHEHDCRIQPEQNTLKHFFVSQPGSSVATSLSEGEAIEKHCGLLLIHNKEFKLEPIKLKTVRPFVFETIDLENYKDRLETRGLDIQDKVQKLIAEKVEEMIERSKKQLTGHPKQPKEPIIRLRMQFQNEEQIFNTIRFGQAYTGRVANPSDMVVRQKIVKKKEEVKPLDKAAMENVFKEAQPKIRVEDIVDSYFETVEDAQRLKILSSKCMAEITRRLVDADDNQAAEVLVDFHVKAAVEFLNQKLPSEQEIPEVLEDFQSYANKTLKDAIENLENSGVDQQASVARQEFLGIGNSKKVKDDDDDEFVIMETSSKVKKPAVTRGRGGGGPGSRGGKAAAPKTTARATNSRANQSNALNISVNL